ncbi:MAG: NYN domain-containing protein, partial [Opitutales bacterium]
MQAHLLVDGYNVIFGLPQLMEIFRRDKERARDELARVARNIHDADAIRVTLVFDGAGSDHEIVRPGKELTFSFLFTAASSTADEVIQGILAQEMEPASVTVVTKDQAIVHATLEAGGIIMNPEDM